MHPVWMDVSTAQFCLVLMWSVLRARPILISIVSSSCLETQGILTRQSIAFVLTNAVIFLKCFFPKEDFKQLQVSSGQSSIEDVWIPFLVWPVTQWFSNSGSVFKVPATFECLHKGSVPLTMQA